MVIIIFIKNGLKYFKLTEKMDIITNKTLFALHYEGEFLLK
jgi:hypothetical protein